MTHLETNRRSSILRNKKRKCRIGYLINLLEKLQDATIHESQQSSSSPAVAAPWSIRGPISPQNSLSWPQARARRPAGASK